MYDTGINAGRSGTEKSLERCRALILCGQGFWLWIGFQIDLQTGFQLSFILQTARIYSCASGKVFGWQV